MIIIKHGKWGIETSAFGKKDMKRQIRNTIMLVLLVLSAFLTACRYPRLVADSKALRDAELAVKTARTSRDRCRAIRTYADQVYVLIGSISGTEIKRVLGEPGFTVGCLWFYDFPIDRVRCLSLMFDVVDGVVESVGSGPVFIDETDFLEFKGNCDWGNPADYSKLCECLWHDSLTFTNVSAEALSTLLTDHFSKAFNRLGAPPARVIVQGETTGVVYSADINGGSVMSQIDDISEKLDVLRIRGFPLPRMPLTVGLDFAHPASGLIYH